MHGRSIVFTSKDKKIHYLVKSRKYKILNSTPVFI